MFKPDEMIATTLGYRMSYGNWLGLLDAGLSFVDEDIGGYVESNGNQVSDSQVTNTQLSAGGELSYDANNGWEPFASARYVRDINHADMQAAPTEAQPANDEDAWRAGLGIRYFGSNGISGVLEYSAELGREQFTNQSVSVQVRADF